MTKETRPHHVGASPQTRPGGFASWTSTKGFALGTHSVPRSADRVQGSPDPCWVQGKALAFLPQDSGLLP
ncbi:protein of unknown function [Rhodovastum atsumiense]|nr:protein of unknown function [Rhodovastum atsumiense]